jgi:hypothetical protein
MARVSIRKWHKSASEEKLLFRVICARTIFPIPTKFTNRIIPAVPEGKTDRVMAIGIPISHGIVLNGSTGL